MSKYPNSFPLLKAAGRLAVALGWTSALAADNAEAGRANPLEWLEAAERLNTTDFEVEYYLGVGLSAAGRLDQARPRLESAQRFRATRSPATLQLAMLLAKTGKPADAVMALQSVAAESPRAVTLGAMEVSLLRRLGRAPEARERLRHWRSVDPTSSLLRYESTLLATSDAALWTQLGADANRVLISPSTTSRLAPLTTR